MDERLARPGGGHPEDRHRGFLSAGAAVGDIQAAVRTEHGVVDLVQAGGEHGADARVQRGAGQPGHLDRRLAAVETGRHDDREPIRGGKRHPRRHAADRYEIAS